MIYSEKKKWIDGELDILRISTLQCAFDLHRQIRISHYLQSAEENMNETEIKLVEQSAIFVVRILYDSYIYDIPNEIKFLIARYSIYPMKKQEEDENVENVQIRSMCVEMIFCIREKDVN